MSPFRRAAPGVAVVASSLVAGAAGLVLITTAALRACPRSTSDACTDAVIDQLLLGGILVALATIGLVGGTAITTALVMMARREAGAADPPVLQQPLRAVPPAGARGPTLETERLVLVPVGEHDVDALLAHWSEPSIARYMWPDGAPEHSVVAALVAESDRTFARSGWGLWAVTLPPDPALIGVCGLRRLPSQPDVVELVYSLRSDLWRRGLTSEAAEAVVDRGFTSGLDRVAAAAAPGNHASLRVLAKLGMRPWRTVDAGSRRREYQALEAANRADAG